MIMINLLPHREERRKRKKIAFYAGLAVAAFVGIAAVGVWYLVVQQLISGQQQRNAFRRPRSPSSTSRSRTSRA